MAKKRSKGSYRNLDFKTKEKDENQAELLEAEFVPDTQPVVLDQPEAKLNLDEIRKRTVQIKESINQNYTELCRNLWLIQKKQLFQNWGYPTFREYASKELDFKETKALYLASIWNSLSVNQDEVVFKEVMALGWSKGKELARVVTRENLSHWLEKAKHVSVDGLVKEVRTFLKKKVPDDPQEALNLEGEVKGTPVEQELKTVTFSFNYEDYLTVSQVYDHVKSEDPHVTLPGSLAIACREYMANCLQSGKEFALQMMGTYANRHGFEIVVIDKETQEIVSGAEVFNRILESAAKRVQESEKAEVKEAVEELDFL